MVAETTTEPISRVRDQCMPVLDCCLVASVIASLVASVIASLIASVIATVLD